MYNIIKTKFGADPKPINKFPYETFEDAQIELIDEITKLCEELGVYEDAEYSLLPFTLQDLHDYLMKSKESNFSSFQHDNYTVQIVKI